jgi:succinate dehydrogenase/fumarate reductase-like Fe-S protein
MTPGISLRIKRFDPARNKSDYETFTLPEEVTEGMTIIDALRYVQEQIDPTLAFYYSCELGRCRGCLLEVDGKATFACTEPVRDGISLEPFSHLPIIKDLVVRFMESEIHLDPAICSGCGACVEACPMGIYSVDPSGETAAVRSGDVNPYAGHVVDCIGCKRCESACSVNAIEIRPRPGSP